MSGLWWIPVIVAVWIVGGTVVGLVVGQYSQTRN